MNTYDEEKREKPSWSERDKMKDQSRHVSQEKSYPKKSKRSEWISKQYRKELERLWKGKKGTDAYKKALNEIHNLHGSSKFNASAKKFIDEYGLPDDWNTLFLFLDYRKADVVKDVLLKLNDLHQTKSLTEIQGFKAKLEIMATNTTNETLRQTIHEILRG
ncbi:MAG: hypothetical protein JXD19_01675 [Deltaproteobacteria bacterium]|nr:hypothetical protein [Deltaproteobacteria bacterium]